MNMGRATVSDPFRAVFLTAVSAPAPVNVTGAARDKTFVIPKRDAVNAARPYSSIRHLRELGYV